MNASAAPVVALTNEEMLDSAGLITFIRMRGDTSYYALAEAWEAAGLDEDLLLTRPSDTVACRRACSKQKGPNLIVRPLHRKDEPNGWALVKERTDTTVHHEPTLHVLPNAIGRLGFETPNDLAKVTPDEHGDEQERLAFDVNADYQFYLENVVNTDVSAWFVKLCQYLHALTLRDTGGFYFIPAHNVATWERMVSAIREATQHDIGLIPAMRTEEAVRSILSSLEHEAETEAQSMFEEIGEGALGKRALETRANRCDSLRLKVAEYEKLLGVSMQSLNDRLNDLQASLAAATMVATSDDNATGVLAL